jgi:hypothetical protein
MRDLALESPNGIPRSSLANASTYFQSHQCCSSFVVPSPRQNVLIIGAERPDEFADALRMTCLGHSVTVVNPRETFAAREFKRKGGTFIQGRVEELPPACRCFDVICENYPYPSGENYVPPLAFAEARLSRLPRGGRWILFTEAVKFATLLKAVTDFDENLPGKFSCALSRVSPHLAPPSIYPPGDTRFRLIFKRMR